MRSQANAQGAAAKPIVRIARTLIVVNEDNARRAATVSPLVVLASLTVAILLLAGCATSAATPGALQRLSN